MAEGSTEDRHPPTKLPICFENARISGGKRCAGAEKKSARCVKKPPKLREKAVGNKEMPICYRKMLVGNKETPIAYKKNRNDCGNVSVGYRKTSGCARKVRAKANVSLAA